MKYLFFVLLLGLSISACKHSHDHSHNQDGVENVDKSGPEYTSAYICPMHCKGSGSDSAGTCPVCGMDYVVNEDLNKEDNDDHDHEDGDHDHNH